MTQWRQNAAFPYVCYVVAAPRKFIYPATLSKRPGEAYNGCVGCKTFKLHCIQLFKEVGRAIYSDMEASVSFSDFPFLRLRDAHYLAPVVTLPPLSLPLPPHPHLLTSLLCPFLLYLVLLPLHTPAMAFIPIIYSPIFTVLRFRSILSLFALWLSFPWLLFTIYSFNVLCRLPGATTAAAAPSLTSFPHCPHFPHVSHSRPRLPLFPLPLSFFISSATPIPLSFSFSSFLDRPLLSEVLAFMPELPLSSRLMGSVTAQGEGVGEGKGDGGPR